MADIPVRLTHTYGRSGRQISYLCDEDHHARCTGLVSPSGTEAFLCACRAPECTCAERARAKHADTNRLVGR